MRTFCLAVLATALALTGCATTEERATSATLDPDDGIDQTRVGVINHIARHRGIKVIWVNLPKKKEAAVAARG